MVMGEALWPFVGGFPLVPFAPGAPVIVTMDAKVKVGFQAGRSAADVDVIAAIVIRRDLLLVDLRLAAVIVTSSSETSRSFSVYFPYYPAQAKGRLGQMIVNPHREDAYSAGLRAIAICTIIVAPLFCVIWRVDPAAA
jgi:hypothetical protein